MLRYHHCERMTLSKRLCWCLLYIPSFDSQCRILERDHVKNLYSLLKKRISNHRKKKHNLCMTEANQGQFLQLQKSHTFCELLLFHG